MLERIDHKAVLEVGSALFETVFFVADVRQMFVQFLESQVVFGDAHIALLGPISKVDAQYWPNSVFRCKPHKIQAGGGVVDVGKRKTPPIGFLSEGQNLTQFERTVLQGVVRVAVQNHGVWGLTRLWFFFGSARAILPCRRA